MDEKIEQLAKEIQCSQEEENCFYCKRRASCCVGFDIALKVIKAGYRKESDTAREILDELLKEENLENVYFTDENGDIRNRQVIRIEKIKDLVKKYGVDLGE